MSTEEILMAAALSDTKIRELVIRKKLITNYGTLSQIEQQGFDLRTSEIYRHFGYDFIGKTERRPPEKKKIEPVGGIYELEQGVYDIHFIEGCNFPNNISGLIKTRSSSNKCGVEITREFVGEGCRVTSGAYDAGFKFSNIAGTLIVHNEYGFKTEPGASLAKMIFFESGAVVKTYNKKREKSNHKCVKKDGGETIKNSTQFSILDFYRGEE